MPEGLKVTYLPAAVRDLEEIIDYVRRGSLERAEKLLNKLAAEIGRLARFPRLAVVPKDPYLMSKRYRLLVIENYLVFYLARRQAILIHRVIHGTRRYESLL